VYLARWSTLLLAGLLAGPALWHAFVQGDLDYGTAMTRFLVAVVVSGLMLAVLRSMAAGYRRARSAEPPPPEPVRRHDDPD